VAPAAVGTAALAATAFAGAVAPHGQAFYPPCPLHRLTGLWCPGCGATRAVHALATGHLGAAVHDNLLLVAALPIVVWLWAGWLASASGRPFAHPLRLPRWWAPAAVIVAVVYGVLRNLPFGPFHALAPLS
jgi:hypothetical protein